jgi:hypothetical protein
VTDVVIRIDGPMFNGLAARAAEQAAEEAIGQIGAQASAHVHANLDRSLRNPTPYYETQVTLDRPMPLTAIVHDRGIVYGPWLEGTGSRNRTTRFKGYASFRRAAQQTERDAQRVTDAVMRRFLPRMGG